MNRLLSLAAKNTRLLLVLFGFLESLTLLQGSIKTAEAGSAPKGDRAVKLEAFVDRAIAKTSEEVIFTLRLTTSKQLKGLKVPEIGDQLAGLRIVEFGQTDPKNIDSDSVQSSRWYKLMADISGSYMIPAVTMSYAVGETKKEVATADIFLEFTPPENLSQDAQGSIPSDIKDIKSIILSPTDYGWAILFISILGAVFVLGCGWWVMRRRLKNKVSPQRPAYEVALEEFDSLKEAMLLERGDIKEFHYRLSESLRKYVEHQFHFATLDRTIEEIRSSIGELKDLSNEAREAFLSFRSRSKLVRET